MSLSPLVLQILQVGFVGLAFLLAYMAYRLLRAQSEKERPSKQILESTSKYMVFALMLALVAVAGQLAQSLIPANIPSDIDGRLQRLSERLDGIPINDYKIKDVYLHTCAGPAKKCECSPGYRAAPATHPPPITNFGSPSVPGRLLCIK